MGTVLDYYDENYRHLGRARPEEIRQKGQWIRTFGCLVTSPLRRTVLLQKKAPGLYPFDRPDHFDVSVGGTYEAGEEVADGVREIREEIGLDVPFEQLIPIGIRQTAVNLPGDYRLREFAHFFLLPLDLPLADFPLPGTEVSGLCDVPIDEGLELLLGRVRSVSVEGLFVRGGGHLEERDVTITADDFYPTVDELFLRLFVAARRLIAGEPRELIRL